MALSAGTSLELTETGAKVLDFWVARAFLAPEGSISTRAEALQAITEEGILGCTAAYMAPEKGDRLPVGGAI